MKKQGTSLGFSINMQLPSSPRTSSVLQNLNHLMFKSKLN